MSTTKLSILGFLALGSVWLGAGLLHGDNPPASPPPPPDPAVTAIWRNPDAPIDDRVKALMSQLTVPEKISLTNWLAPAIPRLGIGEYTHGDEGLHGLVRPGQNTSYPQAVALAATFDPDAIHTMAGYVSDEARARWNGNNYRHLGWASDPLTLWSPVVNMARDPRWGRTQETYGEDPWLTGRMGVAFVRGLQGDDPHYLKAVSTPKHFAGNNVEDGRDHTNIVADERYLQEYELAGFRACITEGGAFSTMAAYTAINGVPAACNKWLLTDVLRGMWGFRGYVVSDCGAVTNICAAHHYTQTQEEGVADAMKAGLDLTSDSATDHLQAALNQGLITQDQVDICLARILTARFKLGMFDPPDRVPFSRIPQSVLNSDEHQALARRLADECMVLLKNAPVASAPLLPIDPARVKKIVVVGPNADRVILGDYSGQPARQTSPLQGLRDRARTAGITIEAVPWQTGKMGLVPSSALMTPEGGAGLKGEYFGKTDLSGTPVGTRIDPQVNFDWPHTAPDPYATSSEFGARWTGSFNAAVAGTYNFSIRGDGGFRLFVDDRQVLDCWGDKSATRQERTWQSGVLQAGPHTLKLEYHHNGGEAGLALNWIAPPAQSSTEAKSADLVIAVMGISPDYEAEAQDRTTIMLPPEQVDFIRKLMAANPHTVVVLESGSALAAPWAAAHVPALVQAWYPGQEGGKAIADVLFGDVNPAGRLPLTFYADDSQLRPMDEYDLTKGRTYMYLRDKPLYPFGHGLSYTTFQYTRLRLAPAGNSHVTATVDVTNTGSRDGDEVVQGYVHARTSSVPMPIKQLWAFRRVSIPAGQTKPVALDFDTKNFGHWDKDQQKFVVEPGTFDIMIGASSSDIRLRSTLTFP